MNCRVLNSAVDGGPYKRLILQTESGEAWGSNEENSDDDIPASSSHSNILKSPTPTTEHVNSCHTLLFLKDQATMDAKLKNEMRYNHSTDLTKMIVIAPEFPKYIPQLDGL